VSSRGSSANPLIAEVIRFLTHMDTLSAGSIVVIATFAEKFSGRAPGGYLAVAVSSFAFSIWLQFVRVLHGNRRPLECF